MKLSTFLISILPGVLERCGGGENAIFSYGIVPRHRALGSKLSAAFKAFFFNIPFTLVALVFRPVWLGEQVRVFGEEFVVSGGVSDEATIRESELVSMVVMLSLPFLLSTSVTWTVLLRRHSISPGRLFPLSSIFNLPLSSMSFEVRCTLFSSQFELSTLRLFCKFVTIVITIHIVNYAQHVFYNIGC